MSLTSIVPARRKLTLQLIAKMAGSALVFKVYKLENLNLQSSSWLGKLKLIELLLIPCILLAMLPKK